MTEKPNQPDNFRLTEEEYEEGMSFQEFLNRQEERKKKLPKPETVFLSLTEAAAVLEITPYKLREAIRMGHMRSKRVTKSPRARFMIHRDWLADYERYQKPPTFSMTIKAWYRRTF